MRSVDELLAHLAALGIKLGVDGERLRLSAPQGGLTPDLQAELAQRKADILAFLDQVGFPSDSGSLSIRPVPREGPVAASFAQQRLWFLDQLEPNSSAYNVPAAYRLVGSLDVTALEQAVNEVVRRHEVLRTTFATVDGEPVQVIAPSLLVPLPVAELELLPTAERETEALRLAIEDAQCPFDLSQGPLLRAGLLRLGAEEHILVLTLHHIVTDGWSIAVFRQELADLYAAFSRGRPSPLPALPVQYADFAVWQRKWLEGGALAGQLAYWRERLEGASEVQLPGDRPRPALLTFDGARQAMSFSSELSLALKALSQREGVTLFMTLLAAFKVLLYRYTGQEDIVVGTPIANRDRAEIEGLIGFFVNTLVLRTDLSSTPSGGLTFRELLARVREVCLGAYAYQHLPFEKLVEELQPQRDQSRNPLFQVLFAVQNAPRAAMEMVGLTVTPLTLDTGRVRFDLECHLWEEGEGIRGVLVYNTNLFDATTIQRMVGHFQTLLEGIVADPRQRLSDLPLLTEAERHQVLVTWNAAAAQYPRDACVHELFAAQVERAPQSVAVQMGQERLTYQELNQRANQLAHCLRLLGVGPEVLVGICVERSLDMVVGQLAILKAGGAYVPLDPTYPAERLGFMLADTRMPALLSQHALINGLPKSDARLICLDRDWAMIAQESQANPPCDARPEHPAYVMYTSGSTGTPKGIVIPHRAISRLVLNTNYIELEPDDRVAQASNAGFDAATFEVWGALLHGARLVILPRDVVLSPQEFCAQLQKQGITTLFLTTALFNLLAREVPGAFRTLRHLLFGGETVDPRSVRQVLTNDPPERLLHVYGPTESTTFASWYRVREVAKGATTVPIGQPISNTQVYLLDTHFEPVPVGVVGELYLGGDGLARGYLNQPALTAERFIPHPFASEPGSRLYRTGDLGRYLPDGSVEFQSRVDRQIKIRGFRIEPAEIEMVLEQHPAVRRALVMAREDLPGGRGLVAYLVVSQEAMPTTKALRSYVRERLPDFMTPAAFVLLKALPLTPNGKVDQRALAKPGEEDRTAKEGIAVPRDQVERQLVRIWEEVLGVHPVGIGDDFFDLGGHSLLGIRLFARIEREMGKKLPVALLFQSPTVEQLAQAIHDDEASPDWATIVPIQAGGSRPPFFCVHGFGGGVLGYAELARLLGPEQPFYGLQARGLNGREEPDARIEDMAAHYVQTMRTVQPKGPYYVGGYCYGGVVAFEMARQLRAQGQQVALLAVLEGYALRRSEAIRQLWRPRALARFVLNLPYWLRDALQKPEARQRLLARLGRKHRSSQERREWDARVEQVIAANFGDGLDIPESYGRLTAMHLQAIRDYSPQVYPGRVTLFRVRALSVFRSYDLEMGWGKLATGGVVVRMVAGAHYNMLEKPHVVVLAAKLKESLEQAQERESARQAAAQDKIGP